MARRRTDIPPSDLRADLADRWREFAARLLDRMGWDQHDCADAFLRRAVALDRGEPLAVAAWEIPRGVLPRRAVAHALLFVVEGDGSLRDITDSPASPSEAQSR